MNTCITNPVYTFYFLGIAAQQLQRKILSFSFLLLLCTFIILSYSILKNIISGKKCFQIILIVYYDLCQFIFLSFMYWSMFKHAVISSSVNSLWLLSFFSIIISYFFPITLQLAIFVHRVQGQSEIASVNKMCKYTSECYLEL